MDGIKSELTQLMAKIDEGWEPETPGYTDIERMKMILKEYTMPSFSDDVLEMLLRESDSFNEAVYRAAIMKSEDTTLSVSGLSTADTSAFFLRIARLYRPNNSGILRGG